MIEARTQIITEGKRALLVGQHTKRSFSVYNGSGWLKTKFVDWQDQRGFLVCLNDGTELICPTDTLWQTNEGRVYTNNLTVGLKIPQIRPPSEGALHVKNPFLKGCLVNAGFLNYSKVDLMITKYHEPFISKLSGLNDSGENLLPWVKPRRLPEEIYDWCKEDTDEFLSGYFGYMGINCNRIVLRGNEPLLRDLQLLMKLAGYNAKINSHRDRTVLRTGFSGLDKMQAALNNPRIAYTRPGTAKEKTKNLIITHVNYLKKSLDMCRPNMYTDILTSHGVLLSNG